DDPGPGRIPGEAAYARDENDEFVKATVIRAEGQADAAMEDGDTLIFMNFRADRARFS
ncbi:2,3-bisphosphoglycerate-independent phosphoglycerate mutase, partial [Salmonella enterica subsp. enterica serovar Inverness str. R8-3668]